MYLADIRREEEEVAASNEYLKEALLQHKSEGLLLAVQARWIALAIIAVFLPFVNFDISVIYYQGLLGGFALIGWAQLRVGRVGRSGREVALIFADLFLMTFTLVVPNPFTGADWPTAMQYHIGTFSYFYVLLASATMAYSWRTLVTYGTWVAGIWLSAAMLVAFLGYKVPGLTDTISAIAGIDDRILEFIDPNRIDFGNRFQEVVIFLIVSSTLALNGWRTNRLLRRQAEVARERANLARHFAPSIVDQMASQNQPLGETRSQDVAVMFADIVGFTGLSERQPPEDIMALLRDFHAHMESAVFDHQGTLHKFLGDGIMATFGTPEPGPDDAANALTCARDMLTRMDTWNEKRRASGKEAVELSIGLHYGNVILGDIGSERLLEFAVIGDAVNVASRLEELTRQMGTRLVVSNALVEAIKRDRSAEQALLQSLTPHQPQTLRGRDDPISVWTRSS
jgi:adenylate cyclase